MALLQQPIQRKLSALVGADVTFNRLNVSLLGGSIDATGVTVAGADKSLPPVLTVARARAEVSIKRALKGEFVVKSLTIERPVVNVVRRTDGTTNVPQRVRADGEAAPSPPPPSAPRPPTDDEEDKSRWSFDVEKVLIVDGSAHVALDLAGGTYRASAEKFLAELKRTGAGYGLTVLADSIGRRDVPVELGQLRGTGTVGNAADLTALPRASLDATFELGQLLKLTVRAGEIASRVLDVVARGTVEAAAVLPLLPPGLDVPLSSGGVTLDLTARVDPASGVRIADATVRVTDAQIRLGR